MPLSACYFTGGTNSDVKAPMSLFTSFTACGFVTPDAVNDYRSVIDFYQAAGAGNYDYNLWIQDNTWYWSWADETNNVHPTAPVVHVGDDWFYCVQAINTGSNTVMKLYTMRAGGDDLNESMGAFTTVSPNYDTVAIGRDHGYIQCQYRTHGVRIWSRALNRDEILGEAGSPYRAVSRAALEAEWQLKQANDFSDTGGKLRHMVSSGGSFETRGGSNRPLASRIAPRRMPTSVPVGGVTFPASRFLILG